MAAHVAYDISVALITGVAAGYYAGLLIAKFSKFNALKYEALRAVRGIDYIGDETKTQILKADRVDDLSLISSEFLQLKHKQAGNDLFRISKEASTALASCRIAAYPVEELKKNISDWQQQLREMRPGLRVLLPWGQI